MKIKIMFCWFDMWIGAYYDRKNKALYLCPLPMIVMCVMSGKPALPETCKWKKLDITTDEDDIIYKMQCGDNHVSTYDAIYNGFKFCPYCGRRIEVVECGL